MIWKKRSWEAAVKQYKAGKMDIQTFVNSMKQETLFYSTPAGNDKDGKPHLYVLSKPDSDTRYYPAFRTEEQCMQFFNALGRNGFLIIKSDLKGLLSSFDAAPQLEEFAAVICPNTPEEMVISPHIRVTK